MRLMSLNFLACPKCQKQLILKSVAEFKDEQQNDPYSQAKLCNLIEKFGRDCFLKIIAELGWPTPQNNQELFGLIFERTVYQGILGCEQCGKEYIIKNRLPCFVENPE